MWRIAILEFAAAFSAVVAMIYLLGPLAARVGLMDHPGGRKRHGAPTPVTGGLAIAVGTIVPAILLTEPSAPLVGLGVGAAILVVVGVIDDLRDLRWQYRIIAQAAAALALIYIGGVKVEQIGPVFGLSAMDLGYLSVPFTVLATVGLINALNMADGLDGLAGGLSLCAIAMLTAAALYAGNGELVNGLVVMAGAVSAFLLFNLRHPWRERASVFLGNSGSAYLGLVMAWAAFRLTQNESHPVSPVLAPFLIAPPVIDCLVLIARRLLHGRSPFDADRTHAHHLLMEAGFSVSGVVATLCGLSLAVGLIAAAAMKANLPQPVFLITYLALTAAYFAFSTKPERASRLIGRITGLRRPAPARAAAPVEPAE